MNACNTQWKKGLQSACSKKTYTKHIRSRKSSASRDCAAYSQEILGWIDLHVLSSGAHLIDYFILETVVYDIGIMLFSISCSMYFLRSVT